MSDDDCDIFSMPTKRVNGKLKCLFTKIAYVHTGPTCRRAQADVYTGDGDKRNRIQLY